MHYGQMWTWRWLVSAESLVLLQLPNKNVKVTEIEILNERNLTLVLVLIYKNGKLKKYGYREIFYYKVTPGQKCCKATFSIMIEVYVAVITDCDWLIKFILFLFLRTEKDRHRHRHRHRQRERERERERERGSVRPGPLLLILTKLKY